MGVYIKGMEMPANCFLCPLSVLNENRLFCQATKNEVVRAKIDANCPLVPVPQHGDLIDADDIPVYDEYEFPFDGIALKRMMKERPVVIQADKEAE